jgi:pimeloyl-ACP methyl ester carboxylesterase
METPEPTAPLAYPGARRPDRQRTVDSQGLAIAVYEWGDPADPPVLLAHGGFDFAGTFDVFAPILAAGGRRVVSWDHRGHGDSEHAALYCWEADLRDALAVFDSVTLEAVPVVGHSKGGSLMLQLADALPHRVSHLVNIDGLPSRRSFPDVSDHQRTKLLAQELTSWLDHRRTLIDAQRKPGTIEELAARRARMNPRLGTEWLQYLVTVGARHDEDGWRWKIDPTLRFGGFGPWRPEWSMMRLPDIGVPVLAMLGTEPDPMGWGTLPDDVISHLPAGGRLEIIEGAGHFLHIEEPHRVAEHVLEHIS